MGTSSGRRFGGGASGGASESAGRLARLSTTGAAIAATFGRIARHCETLANAGVVPM